MSINDKGDRCASRVFTVIICCKEGKVVTSNKISAEIVIGSKSENSIVGIEVSERTWDWRRFEITCVGSYSGFATKSIGPRGTGRS